MLECQGLPFDLLLIPLFGHCLSQYCHWIHPQYILIASTFRFEFVAKKYILSPLPKNVHEAEHFSRPGQGGEGGLALQCTLTTLAAHQGKVGARILGRGASPPSRPKSAPAQCPALPHPPTSPLPPPSPCCSQESKVNWDELSAACLGLL